MPLHKFKIGQEVIFYPAKLAMPALSYRYTIIRQLPPEGGELTYRIKTSSERFERVVRESELYVD